MIDLQFRDTVFQVSMLSRISEGQTVYSQLYARFRGSIPQLREPLIKDFRCLDCCNHMSTLLDTLADRKPPASLAKQEGPNALAMEPCVFEHL